MKNLKIITAITRHGGGPMRTVVKISFVTGSGPCVSSNLVFLQLITISFRFFFPFIRFSLGFFFFVGPFLTSTPLWRLFPRKFFCKVAKTFSSLPSIPYISADFLLINDKLCVASSANFNETSHFNWFFLLFEPKKKKRKWTINDGRADNNGRPLCSAQEGEREEQQKCYKCWTASLIPCFSFFYRSTTNLFSPPPYTFFLKKLLKRPN